MSAFHDHLIRRQSSPHTVKAFMSDLRLLMRFLGRSKPVDRIRTKELRDFLTYLREGRGVPCSPKSYRRRVTTLKSFFRWLHEGGYVAVDPAAPLILRPAPTRLPEILFDDEVERILAVARARRADPDHADARPYLLFTLLLKTGIKKGECVNIRLEHVDLSRPHEPAVYIRYEDARHAHKERKLALPADFPEVFAEYKAQYAPETHLFECTARNLEYVLQGLAEEAGVVKGCSFEMVRMTCAVRDWQAGMDPDRLREKLGLSEITWRETAPKIEKLAAPPL
ncbi:MAG: site-specific integrase [Ardenticatenia bacterium]|nr:site-specific integrase [Ardenticatenia bacterium]